MKSRVFFKALTQLTQYIHAKVFAVLVIGSTDHLFIPYACWVSAPSICKLQRIDITAAAFADRHLNFETLKQNALRSR